MTGPATTPGGILDDFTDVSEWTPVASGQAQLNISLDRGPGGGALRLDFDFKGGGGFVVASKRYSFPLPDAYVFTFDVRGVAPANKLEFKLVDPSGHNVWRYQEDGFGFTTEWRSLRIRSSQIDFAWGPAGSGPMRQVGAIEFAIAAPPGGTGTVWIANLRLQGGGQQRGALLVLARLLLQPRDRLLQRLHVGQHQLGVDRLDVVGR